MAAYLIVLIFIVPVCLGLYIWRDESPKKNLYIMISSVSLLSLLIMVLGGTEFSTFMGLGLFLASTSFFSGVFLSGLLRAYRQKGDE